MRDNRTSQNYLMVIAVVSCIFLFAFIKCHYINTWLSDNSQLRGSNSQEIPSISEFRTVKSQEEPLLLEAVSPEILYKFPRIIHQIWQSDDVPTTFSAWIQTWKKYNPDWEYWFWSKREINFLIDMRYKNLKQFFDKLTQEIKRADIARYMILHTVGGIYVDLDMECLKPLSEIASLCPCFVSEENYEHTNLIYNRKEPIILQGVLGCRSNHQLYKDAIYKLGDRPLNELDVISTTGPLYFSRIHQEYMKRSNISIDNHVTVLPPRYLVPVADRSIKETHNSCQNMRYSLNDSIRDFVFNPSRDKEQSERNFEVCQQLHSMAFKTKIQPESLMTHHWVHTWLSEEYWTEARTTNIHNLVPNVKFFTEIVKGNQSSKFYTMYN